MGGIGSFSLGMGKRPSIFAVDENFSRVCDLIVDDTLYIKSSARAPLGKSGEREEATRKARDAAYCQGST